MEFVLPFASMLKAAALPTLPPPPGLPEIGTHKACGSGGSHTPRSFAVLTRPATAQVCDFLNMFTRNLSGYYGPAGVRILVNTKEVDGVAPPPAEPAAVAAMHARVHLCTAFRQVRKLRWQQAPGAVRLTRALDAPHR